MWEHQRAKKSPQIPGKVLFSYYVPSKDCVGFSNSLVLQQQVKTHIGGYLGHGDDGIGERNFGFDTLKSRLKRDMEEKGIVAICSLPEELLHRWQCTTTYEFGTMERRRNGMDP